MAAAAAVAWLAAACAVADEKNSTADVPSNETAREAADFFESRIRPVLLERCIGCHGGTTAESGLRLDSRQRLLAGGERGAAVSPGNPEQSLLIEAVRRTRDDLQMPPDEPLPPDAVADLTKWVRQGAVWPDHAALDAAPETWRSHWSFQPVRRAAPPVDVGSSENPIDRFLAAKRQALGLKTVGPADRATLVRRASYDLLGLPPTPQEMHEALQDTEPDGWERLIDRLLASPQYGEHWGRHWMDVVRYADTAGDNADYPVPEARLYRDYIIDSFNTDKPIDRFIVEQVAGDLLARHEDPARYAELVTATGFLALSRRYATAPYEFWHLTLEDTIDTIGQAFLGLSLKCARCHDHKFDPVSMKDYYALYGIFDSTQYPWAGGEEFSSKKFHRMSFVPLVPAAETAPVIAAFEQQLSQLAEQITTLEEQLKSAADGEKDELHKRLDALRSEHLDLQRRGAPPTLPVAYAVRDRQPHDVPVQQKGEPAQPGPIVPRGAIEFFNGSLEIPSDESGRLQLAQWLVDPRHPLTARVFVNRVWQQHFGRGLVDTPNNFGVRGSPPSHPDLLDFLTARFVETGWSVKTLHRLILTSQAWQLASDDEASNAAVDPGNLFLWRQNRRRLEAESIRDAMLAAAGRLDPDRPGEHPFPPPHQWKWTQHNPFRDFYDSPHRSVYLMVPRIQRHPFLGLFDGPDTNTSTGVRAVSTVPPQALYLMNSPAMQDIARAFAQRLLPSGADAATRIDLAYRLCYARAPTEEEQARDQEYLREYAAVLDRTDLPRDECEITLWTSYARLLLVSNEFFYAD